MDWNRVEGNWKEFQGKVKEKWGKLTDDDLTAINGKRDQLEGRLQQRYGFAKDQVRKDIDSWLMLCDAYHIAAYYRKRPGEFLLSQISFSLLLGLPGF